MKKLTRFLRDLLPFNIGTFIKELFEKNESLPYELNREQAVKHLLKFIIYAVMLYFGLDKADLF